MREIGVKISRRSNIGNLILEWDGLCERRQVTKRIRTREDFLCSESLRMCYSYGCDRKKICLESPCAPAVSHV